MKKIISLKPWLILSVLLVLLFLINVSLGSVQIPLMDTVSILFGGIPENPVWKDILIDFRLTKALTCVFAGGALALGGLLMQTLFRNPLAGPDVLGLSSGASLAVAILVMAATFMPPLLHGPFSIAIAASLGSALIFIVVLVVANRIKDNTSLLLIGLMIGAATSSLVSVLQFTSRSEDQHYFLVWTFGSMGGLNWQEIYLLGVVFLFGMTLSLLLSKALNAWLLGDNYAQALGIRIQRARTLIIICTSVLAGSVTAFCGPIAFVGLAVPHLARLVINTTNHKILVPGTVLTGAAVMLLCDTVAQLPGSSLVLPINAITSLIGAPVVIWVIVRSKKVRV
ncbi:MAG TPA: iron ABC transporter permease [Cyclobacteriaceae bacterium]|nr:iron ABC transporter permease [Cyclobacteriaceae bacterium]HRJ81806.1 iron ABC transporter permease [Cyclobacteriaceae bacterium]